MFIPLFDGYVLGLLLALFVLVPLIFVLMYISLGIQNLVIGKREKSRLKTSSGGWVIALAIGIIIVTFTVLVIIKKLYFPMI